MLDLANRLRPLVSEIVGHRQKERRRTWNLEDAR